jgi:hypothetical protein
LSHGFGFHGGQLFAGVQFVTTTDPLLPSTANAEGKPGANTGLKDRETAP